VSTIDISQIPEDLVLDPDMAAHFLSLGAELERQTRDMLFNFPDMPEEIRLGLTAKLAQIDAQREWVRRKLL
jgi:hypothetical protein